MEINFLYQVNEQKYLIGNLENKKIKNKQYFFGNLDELDFKTNSKLFLDDKNFLYTQEKIYIKTDKKLSINDINKQLIKFEKRGFYIVGYNISNILVNQEEKKYLLGEKGEITFTLGAYLIDTIQYTKLRKYFGTKIPEIYPNSINTIKNLGEKIKNGNILFLNKDNTKIINIQNSFYKNIEILDLGLGILENKIFEIFGKQLENLNNLTEFHKKIYFKEVDKFLQPLELFIKNNLKGDKIYLIGDTRHFPNLIENLSKKTKTSIVPVIINNKIFKNQEEIDLFYIQK